MSRTRREFLSQAALASAAVGLGPAVVHALQRTARPYREIAVRCAEWIDRSAQVKSTGLAWPADPLRAASVGLDYYNGMPGVVCFFANLYGATGDARWRERAQRGGEHLLVTVEESLDRVGDGLYTGLAGVAATFMALDAQNVGPEWNDNARKMASLLVRRAKSAGAGVEWSTSNDIISGTAGIGLFLLHAGRKWNDKASLDTALRAGRRLIAMGQPAEGGLMWFPAGASGRNYPNFSHGTSGVAYFLATLAEHSKDATFLDAARAGAGYLDAVATRRKSMRAIFHVTGGGENRFYLSWCHGPVGTARLFYRLHQVTGEPRWREWIDELNAWLVDSGAPEKQSDGYWNNISQCCGNVGIGQYCIDLTRQGKWTAAQALSDRVVANTMSRATDDQAGLRWVQAENRVSPEAVVAQTGFMQGAAGVGTFFLQLDALARGVTWPTPWPDTPF